MLNIRITKDGYVERYVFDKYDFNLLYKEYYNKYSATMYNNGACVLQKMNKLENYYYFVPIRFKY